MDHCSPAGDRSSLGNLCTSACGLTQVNEASTHYRCSTAQTDFAGQDEKKEDCGYWNVEEGQKSALEYTVDDEVCAGPCMEKDGSKVCEYVTWEWNQEQQASHLTLSLGSCDLDAGWCWTTIGLIIGGILLGILVIGLIAFFVSKSQYQKASTIDH